jgi:mRNA interferase MazF
MAEKNFSEIKRGDIFIADLEPTLGSEEGKERRVLIVSNDVGNLNPRSPVVIAVPITGSINPKRLKMPMFVPIYPTTQNGQTKPALIDCFQIRVLDKEERLKEFKGVCEEITMKKVNAAIETCLHLRSCPKCESVLLPNKNHCVKCKFVMVRICRGCTNKINSEFGFCPHCGLEREGSDE